MSDEYRMQVMLASGPSARNSHDSTMASARVSDARRLTMRL